MTQEQTEATAVATDTVKKGKKAAAATGNLIFDTAQQIESMTKGKALAAAVELAQDIDSNYFRLGGVLKVIKDNSWFEGSESFDTYVAANFGFQVRKAKYLIEIYENLVTKQIDWSKVSKLGWTKLKELAKILTPENTDEWVAKAANLTVLELLALLKGTSQTGATTSGATTDDTTTMKFKFKPDQVATVQGALAKAKGELNTEYDTVALENIASAYLGGAIQVQAAAEAGPVDLQVEFANLGWEKVLEHFAAAFPNVDLELIAVDGVKMNEDAPANTAGQ